MGGNKSEVRVRLLRGQVNWLDKMQKEPEYGLPDLGKTLRCCVNFASQTEAGTKGVTGEAAELLKAQEAAFPKTPGGEGEEVELGVALAKNQKAWLEHTAGTADLSELTRKLMAICMSRPNPDEVFGVVRCNSGTPAVCDGAVEATERMVDLQRTKDQRKSAL